jgi:hypothetical protein
MSEQSIGQRRVRASFNPSQDSLVDTIKTQSAALIDLAEGLKTAGDAEVARCASLAQTHYEDAAMWAVKAATAGK